MFASDQFRDPWSSRWVEEVAVNHPVQRHVRANCCSCILIVSLIDRTGRAGNPGESSVDGPSARFIERRDAKHRDIYQQQLFHDPLSRRLIGQQVPLTAQSFRHPLHRNIDTNRCEPILKVSLIRFNLYDPCTSPTTVHTVLYPLPGTTLA